MNALLAQCSRAGLAREAIVAATGVDVFAGVAARVAVRADVLARR